MSGCAGGGKQFTFETRDPAAEKDRFFHELRAFAEECGWPAAIANEAELILEEWWTNLASYALGNKADPFVSVRIDTAPEGAAIQIRDNGAAFDPTVRADPDLSLPAEERPIGGLGIFMMKKLSDSITWQREGEFNLLCIEKSLLQPALGRAKT